MAQQSQNNNLSFVTLLGDKDSFDFTIICRGLGFYVHTFILRAKSDYFRKMTTNPKFQEYHSKELNLTPADTLAEEKPNLDDDDNPYLMHAFLHHVVRWRLSDLCR